MLLLLRGLLPGLRLLLLSWLQLLVWVGCLRRWLCCCGLCCCGLCCDHGFLHDAQPLLCLFSRCQQPCSQAVGQQHARRVKAAQRRHQALPQRVRLVERGRAVQLQRVQRRLAALQSQLRSCGRGVGGVVSG